MNLYHFHKPQLTMDHKVFRVAVVFLFCAFINMLATAEINSVDGLDILGVELVGNNELQLSQGDSTTMQYRAGKRELKRPPFSVRGNVLQLGLDEKGREVNNVKFMLTVQDLEYLSVNGSGEAYVRPLKLERLKLAVNGSGDIKAFDIDAGKLEMKLEGSGNIQAEEVRADTALLHLKGSGDIQLGRLDGGQVTTNLDGSGDINIDEHGRAEDLTVRLLGSGDIGLGKLQAARVDATIMGSGDIDVWAETSLDAEIVGSGDIRYRGSPTLSQSIVGSGDLRQRDH
jgi:hypothetical protein